MSTASSLSFQFYFQVMPFQLMSIIRILLLIKRPVTHRKNHRTLVLKYRTNKTNNLTEIFNYLMLLLYCSYVSANTEPGCPFKVCSNKKALQSTNVTRTCLCY